MDKMDKVLSIRYHSGQDEIVEYLTCIQACFYYALKAETELDDKICDIFLRDTTFNITEDFNGKIYDIDFEDGSINQDFFKHHYIKGGKGAETFKKVEELLDKGKCVLIQTVMPRVPFFYEFKGFDYVPTEEERKNNLHAFLAIGHDDKNLYYVETPPVINRDNYVPYPGNDTIGVIEKCELTHAFDEMLNYTYLEIYEKGLINTFPIVKNKLDEIIRVFSKKQYLLDKRRVFPGDEGINWFCDYISSGRLNLEEYSIKYPNSQIHNFLNWKISFVAHRRIHLAKSLTIHKDIFSSDISGLIDSVYGCGKKWKMIAANIIKKNARKEYSIDEGLISCFNTAFCAEREMINKIKSTEHIWKDI